jgi:hypothetical protein
VSLLIGPLWVSGVNHHKIVFRTVAVGAGPVIGQFGKWCSGRNLPIVVAIGRIVDMPTNLTLQDTGIFKLGVVSSVGATGK